MSEEKSKLQLIGEIAEANNKNLELIEEIDRLNNIINELEKVFIECDYQHLQRKLKALKENK